MSSVNRIQFRHLICRPDLNDGLCGDFSNNYDGRELKPNVVYKL